jgi:hypothetical protein
MVDLITLSSITYAKLVDGAEKVEIKHNGRKTLIDAVDHVRVKANVIHDFPKEVASDLLKQKLVRRPDPVLDAVSEADRVVAPAAKGGKAKNDPLA